MLSTHTDLIRPQQRAMAMSSESVGVPPSTNRGSSLSFSDEEDEEEIQFRALLAAISAHSLLQIATQVRGQSDCQCTIIGEPLSGSYNLVYIVEFSDGLRWVARIPRSGTRENFIQADATSMLTQARFLRLLRQRTTIPTPDVFHVDTSFNNALGAPFMLMSWVEGTTIRELWHDTNGPTPLQQRRERTLQTVASAMLQLHHFTFPTIGKIIMNSEQDDKKIELGPISVARGWLEPEKFEIGPFESTSAYLKKALQTSWSTQETRRERWRDAKRKEGFIDYVLGQQTALRMMIDSIPQPSREGFVLTHPDFDKHNFMIHEDGTLSGILDWDGIASVPRGCGYARYPSWIIQDWNPFDYQHIDPDSNEDSTEDSQRTLKHLREIYHNFIGQHSKTDSVDNVNAHVMDAITLASSDELYGINIVDGIMKRCFRDLPFDVDYILSLGKEAGSSCSKASDRPPLAGKSGSFDSMGTPQKSSRTGIAENCGKETERSWIGISGSRNAVISYYRSLFKSLVHFPYSFVRLVRVYQSTHDEDHSEEDKMSERYSDRGVQNYGSRLDSTEDSDTRSMNAFNHTSSRDSENSPDSLTAEAETGEEPDNDNGLDSKVVSWCYMVYEALSLNALQEEHIRILRSRFRDMFTENQIFE